MARSARSEEAPRRPFFSLATPWTVLGLLTLGCLIGTGTAQAAPQEVLVDEDWEIYASGESPDAPWTSTTDTASHIALADGASAFADGERLLLIEDDSGDLNPSLTASLRDEGGQPLLVEFDWMTPQISNQSPSVLLGCETARGAFVIAGQLFTARNPEDQGTPWLCAHTGGEPAFLLPFKAGEWYRVAIEMPVTGEARMNLLITRQGHAPRLFQDIPLRQPDVPVEQLRFLDNTQPDRQGRLFLDNIKATTLAPGQFGHSFDAYRLGIPNGSFEVGQGPWVSSNFYGPGLEISRSENAAAGRYSLQLAKVEPESAGWLDSPILPWPPNQPVQLHLWLKAAPELAGQTTRLELTWNDWGTPTNYSWNLPLSEDWQERVIDIPAIPAVQDAMRLRLHLPGKGWIRLDGVELREAPYTAEPPTPVASLELAWDGGIPLVYPGESARLHLRVGPLSGGQVPTLSGAMLDDRGQVNALPPATWSRDDDIAEAVLDFGPRPIGLYNLDLRLTDYATGETIAAAQPSFASIHRPAQGKPWVGIFVADSPLKQEAAPALVKIGLPYVRFGAAQAWHVIRSQTPGQWKRFEAVKQVLKDYGLKEFVILQGAPISIRTLYGKRPGRWQRILGLHWDDAMRRDWENYVKAVGANDAYFCGYEAWNETNANSYYLGSTTSVAGMLEANREALTRAGVSPENPVLGPTTSHIPLVYIRNVLEQVAPGTVDGVSIHPYRNGRGSPEETGYTGELDELRQIMADNGLADGHLWATELGISSSDLPRLERAGLAADTSFDSAAKLRLFPSDDEVANYVLRTFIMGLTRGVDRQFYFLWQDLPRTHLQMGLVRADRPASPKLPLLSVSTLQALLNGAVFDHTLYETAPLYAYAFQRGDRQVVVAWTQEGRMSARLDAPADTRLLDRFGRDLSLTDTLILSEAPVFIEAPADADIRLTPLSVPTGEPVVLRQDRPVKVVLELDPERQLPRVLDVSCPSQPGQPWDPWPLSVLDWQIESDRLILTLAPGSDTLSGYGFSEVCLHTADDEAFLSFPVKFTTRGTADASLALLPNPGTNIQSTDGEASFEAEGDTVTLTVPPVPDYWGPRFEGVFAPLDDPDISGFGQLSFEVKTLEPSLDMQMRVLLKAEDSTIYYSWMQPDVLTTAGNWQTVKLPLETFGLTKLSMDFQTPPHPPLDAMKWVIVSVNGNNPEAGLKLCLRNLRLEP